jgi:hypothetical protein
MSHPANPPINYFEYQTYLRIRMDEARESEELYNKPAGGKENGTAREVGFKGMLLSKRRQEILQAEISATQAMPHSFDFAPRKADLEVKLIAVKSDHS